MFRLQVLAEMLPLTPIFQTMTFIHYVQRLENVTKIARFNLPSILLRNGMGNTAVSATNASSLTL